MICGDNSIMWSFFQIRSYDEAGDEDEMVILKTSCMKELIALANVDMSLSKKPNQWQPNRAMLPKTSRPTDYTMATTTPLVRHVFEKIFHNQMQLDERKSKELFDLQSGNLKEFCGICEGCTRPDCGKCGGCKKMLKYGGDGKSKKAVSFYVIQPTVIFSAAIDC